MEGRRIRIRITLLTKLIGNLTIEKLNIYNLIYINAYILHIYMNNINIKNGNRFINIRLLRVISY